MALKFYLYQIDNQHEIRCNTNSTITEIAGVFDLGTMELEWNECKYAIFPNTPFFIVDSKTQETWSSIITQDNVEVVKKTNPIKYLHRLTLSQSIHKLNNVPLRNTSFSQPYNYKRTYKQGCFYSGNVKYDENFEFKEIDENIVFDHNFNAYQRLIDNYKINLNEVSKIQSAYIKVNTKTEYYSIVDEGYEVVNNTNQYYQIIGGLNQISSIYDVSSVKFRILDATNLSNYIDVEITNLNDKKNVDIPLNNEQVNFIRNHRQIIVCFIGGKFGSFTMGYQGFPSSIDDSLGYHDALLIGGLVTWELSITAYNYSMWDVLDTLNKQCIKRYNGSQLPNYYTMPNKTTGQGLELDSTIAPEFNFTQMDLYEAVAKVLSFIDAFPVLTENNVLGYQYLNDLSKETIYNLQISDIKTTLNEENFTNKLASYYQNGKKEEPITYPNSTIFRQPSTTRYGIPEQNDWYFMLPKPIDYVEKLEILFPYHAASGNTSVKNLPRLYYTSLSLSVKYTLFDLSVGETIATPTKALIDLTPVLYQSEIQNGFLIGVANQNFPTKYNTLSYSKNDNKIFCGITGKILNDQTDREVMQYAITRALLINFGFGTSNESRYNPMMSYMSIGYQTMDKTKCFYRCVYYPILDGKVSQESISNKSEKETIVAQANSSSELNRLGNNLQGLIAKLGNEEKSVTLPITTMKDRIKIGTHYIDDLGNNWIVNKVKTTFTTHEDKVVVEATFTKNFNAMQQYTRLNQEKRMYEISNLLISKGYENINEFIYFTNNKNITNTDLTNLSSKIAFHQYALMSIIDKTFGNEKNEIKDYVTIFENTGVWFHKSSYEYVKSYIQPIVYGNGNQICFEMSFDDSINVGSYYDSQEIGTKACPYVSQDGKADYVVVINCFINKNTVWTEKPTYPELPENMLGTNIFELNDYYYYKKPNEIFHLNYALNFMPYWKKTTENDLSIPQYTYEEIFFGDRFINKNKIIPNQKNQYEKIDSFSFDLWVSNSKFSIVDNKVDSSFATKIETAGGTSIETENYANQGSATQGYSCYGKIKVYISNDPEGIITELANVSTYKSWCITDKQGNILIAVNRNENSSDYAELKWFTSRNRKV